MQSAFYRSSVAVGLNAGGIGLGLLGYLFTLIAAPYACGEDPSVRSRFLAEYEPHYQAIVDYYSTCHGKYEFHENAGKGKTRVTRADVKSSLTNYLLVGSRNLIEDSTGKLVSEGEPDDIEGGNSQYSFKLHKKSEREFVLKDVKIHGSGPNNSLSPLSVAYADYWGRERTYLDLVRDETVRCLAFDDCVWQNKPMKELKVVYTIIHPQTKKPKDVTTGYYFSPADGWICCGKQDFPVGNYKQVYAYDYVEGLQFPTLRRMETTPWNNEEKRKVIEVTEFEHLQAPLPETDFRLTAFGLPEPMGVTWQQQPRYWLWLLVAAGACAVIAALLMWLRQRRLPAVTPR